MKIERFDIDGNLIFSQDSRTLEQAKEECINTMRLFVNRSVFIHANLDEATQQNAALGIYSPERCEAIKSYISACRNEYLRCKAEILAAQTNDEADAVQFLAPPVPEGI